jgi:hypothetical protein
VNTNIDEFHYLILEHNLRTKILVMKAITKVVACSGCYIFVS